MKKICALILIIAIFYMILPGNFTQAVEYSVPDDYVILNKDSTVAWSLQQDLYVDLHGYSLLGTIITNGYKIYGMDASTDEYDTENMGVFHCFDENGNLIIPEAYVKTDISGQSKSYLTIVENGYFTFHRLYFGITHISLAPVEMGVGFKAEFRCSESVDMQIQSVGYHLWMENGNPITRSLDGFRTELSLRIKNFDPALYGQTPIYATVFVTLRDGTVLESAESMVTFRGVIEAVNDQYSAFTSQQLNAVRAMVDAYPVIQTWNVANLLACRTHKDVDNNGSCDLCEESVIVSLDFYAINDLHGKMADGDSHVGVDELSTFIKNQRSQKDNVILLSSGDMWQGAAESNLTKGMIITDWMNEMDFVSMTLGNHEFDWGESYIIQNEEFAEFPFLAINIYDKSTGNRVDYCRSSVVVEADGIQVGIIGAIGNCYSSISADRTTGVTFKTGTQLTNLVKAESERLRSEGVDFIVLSIHDGGESSSDLSHYNTALSNGYVDLVFEGHSHQSYVQKDSYGVYHLQGGGDNTGITYASVQYNTVHNTYTVSTAQTMRTSAYSELPDDPVVLQLMNKYNDLVSKANEILGRNRTKRTEKYICDTVAKLYCDAALEKWGDSYKIVLGGGYLSTRSPYTLSAGNVTYGKLMSLLPFDNRLVLCSIKGSDLKSKFINTTNSDYHIAYTEYGNSVKNNISNNVVYYVVVDTYTAYYSPNKLTIVEFYEDDMYARDLLAQYIKAGNLN